MNAAIEAARSGEHGKGFTVVANEIRKLSLETEAATQKIAFLIKQAKTGINKTVEEVANTERIVSEQENAVQNTTSSFNFIFEAVSKVSEQINRVVQNIIIKGRYRYYEKPKNWINYIFRQ